MKIRKTYIHENNIGYLIGYVVVDERWTHVFLCVNIIDSITIGVNSMNTYDYFYLIFTIISCDKS